MGWSGKLTLLGMGVSGGGAPLLGHGREASSQEKRFPSFGHKYYAPYSGQALHQAFHPHVTS